MTGRVEIAGLTAALGFTGFAHSAGGTKLLAYDAVDLALVGLGYQIAADVNNQAVPATDVNTEAAFLPIKQKEACILLAVYNPKTAAFGLAQGKMVTLDEGNSLRAVPLLPPCPKDNVPIGYLAIKNTAAANFVIGTDNWNKAGATVKSGALATLPHRPPVTSL